MYRSKITENNFLTNAIINRFVQMGDVVYCAMITSIILNFL